MSDLRQCRGSLCELSNFNDFYPKECTIAAGQPCVHCSELAKLDAEAYDLLTTLRKRRQEIKEKINLHHGYPLHNFPPEIIATIFTFYVNEANAYLLENGPSNDWSLPFTLTASDRSPPFTLAAVCKRWRQVAQKTPGLWTTVNMRIGRTVSVQAELVAQWLAGSGQLPLDISLNADPSFYNDNQNGQPIFDILREYLPRWQSFKTRLSPATNMNLLDDLAAASSLQTLHTIPAHLPFKFNDPSAGNRFRIDLQCFYTGLVKTQWASLTSVVMVDVTVKQVFQLLLNNAQLFACSLQAIMDRDDPHFVRFHPTIIHECLRELKLIDMRSQVLNALLDKIILPSLDSFFFSHFYPSVACHLSFFAVSRCPITTFDFNSEIEDHDMINILEALPTIKYLSINFRSRFITNLFFKRLSNHPFLERDTLLPHLEELNITGTQCFSWPCFLETLQLRWLQNPPDSLHKHVSVSLKLCIHIEPRAIPREGILKRVKAIDAEYIRQLTSIPKEVLSLDIFAGNDDNWVDLIQISSEYHDDQVVGGQNKTYEIDNGKAD